MRAHTTPSRVGSPCRSACLSLWVRAPSSSSLRTPRGSLGPPALALAFADEPADASGEPTFWRLGAGSADVGVALAAASALVGAVGRLVDGLRYSKLT